MTRRTVDGGWSVRTEGTADGGREDGGWEDGGWWTVDGRTGGRREKQRALIGPDFPWWNGDQNKWPALIKISAPIGRYRRPSDGREKGRMPTL